MVGRYFQLLSSEHVFLRVQLQLHADRPDDQSPGGKALRRCMDMWLQLQSPMHTKVRGYRADLGVMLTGSYCHESIAAPCCKDNLNEIHSLSDCVGRIHAMHYQINASHAPLETFLLGSRSYNKLRKAVPEPPKSLHTCTT